MRDENFHTDEENFETLVIKPTLLLGEDIPNEKMNFPQSRYYSDCDRSFPQNEHNSQNPTNNIFQNNSKIMSNIVDLPPEMKFGKGVPQVKLSISYTIVYSMNCIISFFLFSILLY